jgi:hypothetical protein
MKTESKHPLELIEKILTKQVEFLTKEEANFLLEHKDVCTRKLLPILALEVTQLQEGEDSDLDRLQACLKLLAGFEENRAFDWIVQLHEFPEIFEDGTSSFVVRFWTDLLVATVGCEWYKLKPCIEDVEGYLDFRESCIQALVILVAKDRIDRSQVVSYFNDLYSKFLSGEIEDPELLEMVLESSVCIWPGDSMEQIRELFGFDLVDNDFIDLIEVIDAFEQGKEQCFAEVLEWFCNCQLIDFFSKEEEFNEDFSELDGEDFFEEEETDSFEEMERMRQSSFPIFSLDCLSLKEKKKYQKIPKLLLDDSEQALETAAELFADHPDNPILLYSFYHVLKLLDEKVLCMAVLKKWIERFPEDLLGKIEHAQYFLRRGETEKVGDLFANTWSLEALYPERKTFHAIECLKFFYLKGCYFLELEEIEIAQAQAQILDAMGPNNFECYDLQEKIDVFLQEDSSFENL